MREVNENKFRTIRDREDKLFRTKYCPVHHSILEFSKKDFTNSFWALWPYNLEDDIMKLQKITVDENKNRKKYFRLIRQVTKSEVIIFNALMIGSSDFVQRGQHLWNTNDTKIKRQEKKLLANAHFGTSMKLWRFKGLFKFVPKIMEDDTLKEEGDGWL